MYTIYSAHCFQKAFEATSTATWAAPSHMTFNFRPSSCDKSYKQKLCKHFNLFCFPTRNHSLAKINQPQTLACLGFIPANGSFNWKRSKTVSAPYLLLKKNEISNLQILFFLGFITLCICLLHTGPQLASKKYQNHLDNDNDMREFRN